MKLSLMLQFSHHFENISYLRRYFLSLRFSIVHQTKHTEGPSYKIDNLDSIGVFVNVSSRLFIEGKDPFEFMLGCRKKCVSFVLFPNSDLLGKRTRTKGSNRQADKMNTHDFPGERII